MEFIKKIYKIIYMHRKLCLAILDVIVIIASYCFAQFIILDESIIYSKESFIALGISSLISIIIYELFFIFLRIYSSITRYENGKDYLIYIFIALSTSIITALSELAFYKNIATLKINLLAGILIAMSMIAYRIMIRLTLSSKDKIFKDKRNENIDIKNVLIIGAGSSARDIIKIVKEHMSYEYNVIGMIDDNTYKLHYNISGVRVLGSRNDIISICNKYKVSTIFFTISKISAKDKKEILNLCQDSGAKLRILPSTEDYIKSNKNLVEQLKNVEIEDILYRDPIVLDNNNIAKLIEGNVILVTGGGGSIGSELCRQIMTFNPKKLVIVDIYENNLYDIEIELKAKYGNKNIDALVASVRDKKAIEMIFKKYNPYLVFHAAAHKHVPLMENSPAEAIKNNVFGTYNVVNLSDKYNVKRFILISSDKAVNPTNIMGATKRLCEMIIQAKNKISKTEFAAVRFGNVLR
ncbi:MAG: polysaccharide biosynthesis protein [Clostridia bacterium]